MSSLQQRIDKVSSALSVEHVTGFEIAIDEEGEAFAVFANGFDLLEFNVKYPDFFGEYYTTLESFNGFENSIWLGRLH